MGEHPIDAKDDRTFGERVADAVVRNMGSWMFIFIQATLTVAWIIANGVLLSRHPFDPYPFILLNLLYSFQAGFTGPILLLAGNRSAQRDRELAGHTFEVDQEALEKINRLLAHIEDEL